MKYLFFSFLFCNSAAFSQLVYIGIDKPFFKDDAYGLNYKTPGAVIQGSKYFYLSPNANLIETDDTEIGTKSVSVGGPNPKVAYLYATNNFVYYGKNPFKNSTEDIERYNPSTKVRSFLLSYPEGLNDAVVPGSSYTVSEIFLGSKKDKIFIRTAETNKYDQRLVSRIYSINDNNPNKIYTVLETYTLADDGTVAIATGSQIADFGNDVFINGRSKPTGTYEVSTEIRNGPMAADTFKSTAFYILKKKGLFLSDDFLQTDTAIYSMVSYAENGINKYSLWQYVNRYLKEASPNLIVQTNDYAAEVQDGVIYVSCKGSIFPFNEATHNFIEIKLPEAGGGLQNISDKKRILKSGNYLMCNINGSYKIYNLLTRNWSDTETPILPAEPNRYRLTPTYAYATSKNFMYFKMVDGKEQLVSYSPVDNTTKTVTFPVFGKESFESICSFSQAGDKFFIVAAYAHKKSKTYRMFMLSN